MAPRLGSDVNGTVGTYTCLQDRTRQQHSSVVTGSKFLQKTTSGLRTYSDILGVAALGRININMPVGVIKVSCMYVVW